MLRLWLALMVCAFHASPFGQCDDAVCDAANACGCTMTCDEATARGVRLRSSHLSHSLACLLRAADACPSNATIAVELATTYIFDMRVSRAIATYRRALSLASSDEKRALLETIGTRLFETRVGWRVAPSGYEVRQLDDAAKVAFAVDVFETLARDDDDPSQPRVIYARHIVGRMHRCAAMLSRDLAGFRAGMARAARELEVLADEAVWSRPVAFSSGLPTCGSVALGP